MLSEEALECQVYVNDYRVCEDVESELAKVDSNNCKGVHCGIGLCRDKLAFFQCVVPNGTVYINQQCGQL